MKSTNLLKLVVATFFVAALIAGCDTLEFEEADKTYSGPEWVNFENGSASVSEAADSAGISIPILRSSADQPLTVMLSVESEYVEEDEDGEIIKTGVDASDQFDFVPSELEVTFAEGEYQAMVQIIPVNNEIPDGNKMVTITIESVSSDIFNIGFDGPENKNSLLDLTIIDDDCPIDFAAWEGTFSVDEVFTSGTNEGVTLAGIFGETYQVELTQDADDPTGFTYVINNSEGANEYVPDGTRVMFNSCAGTVTFDDPLQIAVFANLAVQSTSFTEEPFTITASGPLGNFGPYEFTFTKVVEE